MRIDNAIGSLSQAIKPAPLQADGEDFGNMLTDALKEVNAAQNSSRDMQNRLMANQPVDVDDLMITLEKASVAMQLTLQVRNKLMEAYQEISRMQI